MNKKTIVAGAFGLLLALSGLSGKDAGQIVSDLVVGAGIVYLLMAGAERIFRKVL